MEKSNLEMEMAWPQAETKETGGKWWLLSSYKVGLYSLDFVSKRWTVLFLINFLNLNKLEWISVPYNQMIADQIISASFKISMKI